MANIILRFSFYTKKEYSNNELVALKAILPQTDRITIMGSDILHYITNEPLGKKHLETSFEYWHEFTEVCKIDMCNTKWLDIWETKIDILKKIKEDYQFDINLDYEITIFDSDYPELYFSPNFLLFLGQNGVVLSFYYYNNTTLSA